MNKTIEERLSALETRIDALTKEVAPQGKTLARGSAAGGETADMAGYFYTPTVRGLDEKALQEEDVSLTTDGWMLMYTGQESWFEGEEKCFGAVWEMWERIATGKGGGWKTRLTKRDGASSELKVMLVAEVATQADAQRVRKGWFEGLNDGSLKRKLQEQETQKRVARDAAAGVGFGLADPGESAEDVAKRLRDEGAAGERKTAMKTGNIRRILTTELQAADNAVQVVEQAGKSGQYSRHNLERMSKTAEERLKRAKTAWDELDAIDNAIKTAETARTLRERDEAQEEDGEAAEGAVQGGEGEAAAKGYEIRTAAIEECIRVARVEDCRITQCPAAAMAELVNIKKVLGAEAAEAEIEKAQKERRA